MATTMETAPSSADDAPAINTLKRRQEDDETVMDGKRQKTITGKDSPVPAEDAREETEDQPMSPAQAHSPSPLPSGDLPADVTRSPSRETSRPNRVRSGAAVDEKQRSKRLFGALLGNLTRPSDRASKRRAEIEQRRKAELQQQDDERLEDRQRRLERLAVSRRRIQIDVDEDNMLARHRSMLKAANFLQTRTEPRVYYRPYDLLPDQEDTIDDQLHDIREQIDKELDDFDRERARRIKAIEENVPGDAAPEDSPSTLRGDEEESSEREPRKEADHDAQDKATVEGDRVINSTGDAEASGSPLDNAKSHEPSGEVDVQEMVDQEQHEKATIDEDDDPAIDGDEDTVIY